MTDVFDQASDREERDREAAIAAARSAALAGPLPCGQCHNCGAVVQGDMRFCDLVDCRDDWQAREGRR